ATATASLPGTQTVEVPTIDPLSGAPPYISPNQSPGIQDTFNVATTVHSERAGTAWTVDIYDSAGTTLIRSIAGSGGGSGTSFVINASWDGRIAPAGPFAVDGTYQVRATFTDPYGNTGTTAFVPVVVDNKNPTATALTNQNLLIAPGTGLTVPGSTELTSTVGDENFDHWTLAIASNATTVRTF